MASGRVATRSQANKWPSRRAQSPRPDYTFWRGCQKRVALGHPCGGRRGGRCTGCAELCGAARSERCTLQPTARSGQASARHVTGAFRVRIRTARCARCGARMVEPSPTASAGESRAGYALGKRGDLRRRAQLRALGCGLDVVHSGTSGTSRFEPSGSSDLAFCHATDGDSQLPRLPRARDVARVGG